MPVNVSIAYIFGVCPYISMGCTARAVPASRSTFPCERSHKTLLTLTLVMEDRISKHHQARIGAANIQHLVKKN
jgi:hypothetical protein